MEKIPLCSFSSNSKKGIISPHKALNSMFNIQVTYNFQSAAKYETSGTRKTIWLQILNIDLTISMQGRRIL